MSNTAEVLRAVHGHILDLHIGKVRIDQTVRPIGKNTVAQSQIGDLQPQIIVLIIGELGISNRDHIRVLELERGP